MSDIIVCMIARPFGRGKATTENKHQLSKGLGKTGYWDPGLNLLPPVSCLLLHSHPLPP